jgi:nudix-type nucleoside diphosphatase (YffH/AdpP family)
MVAIRSTKLAHDGWLKLRVATLSGDDGVEFTREIEDHGPAVAVLPYDPERRTALLVQLPRAPVLFAGAPCDFPEVPAGIREDGEDPVDCARREAEEEVGVKLDRLEQAGHVWSMCGISTERMHLFLAPYTQAQRVSKGGGLAEEHENITVMEMPLAELRAMADRNAIADMKTLALVQTLRLRRPELFA